MSGNEPSKFLLSGQPDIVVHLRRSGRAKRYSLRVSQKDGRVTLTLPPRAPLAAGLEFLNERETWIRGHVANQPRFVPCFGQTLPLRGRAVELKRGKGRAPVLQDGSLFVPGEDGQLGRRVEAFLKLGARDALSTACDGYSAQIGREYGRLTLRDVRSRWGSCTTEGNLMFSWRLIMAPPEILNYVAAHEVAHLAEMNHAPAFWEIVRTLDPNFKEHRHWLRENGAQLLQWVFRD